MIKYQHFLKNFYVIDIIEKNLSEIQINLFLGLRVLIIKES